MRKAKKLVIPVRTPGVAVAASKVRQVALDAAPARAGAAEIVEAGTAQEAASILVDKLIAEKVI
ncbi:MAG: hypothetical protein JXB47_13580, partial [Anaerolineae bacterium]|nr:hypothetical protein [Anaerolineae bacterium]